MQLVLDFKHKFSDESNNLFVQWPELSNQLEKLTNKTRIEDPVGKKLLARLKGQAGERESHSDGDTDDEVIVGEIDDSESNISFIFYYFSCFN